MRCDIIFSVWRYHWRFEGCDSCAFAFKLRSLLRALGGIEWLCSTRVSALIESEICWCILWEWAARVNTRCGRTPSLCLLNHVIFSSNHALKSLTTYIQFCVVMGRRFLSCSSVSNIIFTGQILKFLLTREEVLKLCNSVNVIQTYSRHSRLFLSA
jgi:hypothetical protein